jgi:hypothetical protein
MASWLNEVTLPAMVNTGRKQVRRMQTESLQTTQPENRPFF